MGNRLHIGEKVHAGAMRVVLAVVACALALSTLVSEAAISELHDHDCVGDGCPTCLVLDASQAVLSLAAPAPQAPALSAVVTCLLAAVLAVGGIFSSKETPVSLKVRLVI